MLNLYDLQVISRNNPANCPTPEDFLTSPRAPYGNWLAFESKEEYLAWRAEWKRAYAELSADIRATRKEWRAEGQHHEYSLNHHLWSRRALARTMLSLRKASKMKAQARYLAERESQQVA